MGLIEADGIAIAKGVAAMNMPKMERNKTILRKGPLPPMTTINEESFTKFCRRRLMEDHTLYWTELRDEWTSSGRVCEVNPNKAWSNARYPLGIRMDTSGVGKSLGSLIKKGQLDLATETYKKHVVVGEVAAGAKSPGVADVGQKNKPKMKKYPHTKSLVQDVITRAKDLGLSVRELAEATDISTSSSGDLLNDRRETVGPANEAKLRVWLAAIPNHKDDAEIIAEEAKGMTFRQFCKYMLTRDPSMYYDEVNSLWLNVGGTPSTNPKSVWSKVRSELNIFISDRAKSMKIIMHGSFDEVKAYVKANSRFRTEEEIAAKNTMTKYQRGLVTRVKNYVHEMGSIQAAADAAPVSYKTIHRIVNDEIRAMAPSTEKKIAAFFGKLEDEKAVAKRKSMERAAKINEADTRVMDEVIAQAAAVAEEEMKKPESALEPKLLHCSFCGKNQTQVQKLIAAEKAYICNECIESCVDILLEQKCEVRLPKALIEVVDEVDSKPMIQDVAGVTLDDIEHVAKLLVSRMETEGLYQIKFVVDGRVVMKNSYPKPVPKITIERVG
jgi:hypothetical protein